MDYQPQGLPLVWADENEGYACPVCRDRAKKKLHNKKDYTTYKPYPVRLGYLKEILHEDSVNNDKSIGRCIIDGLEIAYSAKLDELANATAVFFFDVVALMKSGYSFEEAMEHKKIEAKLFMRGLNDMERKEIEMLVRKSRFTQMEIGEGLN